jgi:hypothetical protein
MRNLKIVRHRLLPTPRSGVPVPAHHQRHGRAILTVIMRKSLLNAMTCAWWLVRIGDVYGIGHRPRAPGETKPKSEGLRLGGMFLDGFCTPGVWPLYCGRATHGSAGPHGASGADTTRHGNLDTHTTVTRLLERTDAQTARAARGTPAGIACMKHTRKRSGSNPASEGSLAGTAAVDPLRTFGTPLETARVHQPLRTRLMQRESPEISRLRFCCGFLDICNANIKATTISVALPSRPPHARNLV